MAGRGVALAFAGGSGVVVYLLLWLLMPAGPARPAALGNESAGSRDGPRGTTLAGPGVTIAALLLLAGVVALITRFSGWGAGRP